jgi:hypothetical protein
MPPPRQLPAGRGQAAINASSASRRASASEPDALQRPHRVAQRQHVGALGTGRSQRAHDEQDGAARVVALGRLRSSASTPVSGRYPVAGCGVRLAVSHSPIGTSMSSASSTVASRCSLGAEPAAHGQLLDCRQRRWPPAAPIGIGDIDQRQPMRQARTLGPAARRLELAGEKRDLEAVSANAATSDDGCTSPASGAMRARRRRGRRPAASSMMARRKRSRCAGVRAASTA